MKDTQIIEADEKMMKDLASNNVFNPLFDFVKIETPNAVNQACLRPVKGHPPPQST